ncbi:MAG: hypothetical protein J5947_09780 [Clostridium sp.]|nr:hypothetical protein [Clostridium sp.]
MSDMNFLERERNKDRLRRNIIDTDRPAAPAADSEEEEIVRAAEKSSRKRRRMTVLTVLILLAAAFIFYRYYRDHHLYGDYSVTWSREIPTTEGSFTGFARFGNNVLKYTKDGASYINKSGNMVWSISYEMKAPVCCVNGEYAVIADQQGNDIHICNLTGETGQATTNLPIMRASVSAHGIVAAIVEDNTSSYVSFFKPDGSTLEWGIKTVLSGNGYLMDVAISPDGTQVMLSDVYLSSGILGNRIVFYNFSEYGKSYPDRLVGGFDEFGQNLCPRVRFLSDRRAVAFSSGQVAFFSLENVTSPALSAMVEFEDEIRGVAWSDRYVAVVTADSGGEHDSRLYVYNANGTEVSSTGFTFPWQAIDVDRDFVILRSEDSVKIIGVNGKERFTGSFDFSFSKIVRGSGINSLIVTGGDSVREVRLK